MIFSSFEYIIFFLIILFLMIVIKSKTAKKAILLISSYFFYAYWDYRFVVLMFIISVVNYFTGLKISTADNISVKRKFLALSIIFNLIILGFFKYFNFFIESFNEFLKVLDVRFPAADIILPVGISFITFEVISYTIDIYRGNSKSAKNFWDLALLVSFFPHLIAGPILKPMQFLPQLDKEILIKWKNVEYGIQIFIFGLIKKIIIADNIAVFVDVVFKNPAGYSSATIWIATIGYAIQIFCDFSGYTDMAIGSAKCLGFDIPANFNMPYISKNITEFWRRWHISLSNWLREYLYFSLGGNKKGKLRQYLNLITVMLLGGLWHGASWNFVFWGGLHGTALAVHKKYSEKTENFAFKETFIYKFFAWALTLIFVSVCWVFFRSKNFSDSWIIMQKLFYIQNTEGINWFATSVLAALPFVLISHYIGHKLKQYPHFSLESIRGLCVLFFVLFGFLFLKSGSSSPFIYFQF